MTTAPTDDPIPGTPAPNGAIPADLTLAALLARPDSLLICRKLAEGMELHVAVLGDPAGGERVIGFNGHVDLGTGVRTALAQIVAEELDMPLERVAMVLGDTARAPNQGPTIASETIQYAAIPLRRAAAQARHALVARAAELLACPVASLTVDQGIVHHRDSNRSLSYGEILAGQQWHLSLADQVTVKKPSDYRLVGTSSPRVDIPAKVTGEAVYVHDVRVPGMVHGRVVRPPYAGIDGGDFIGHSLIRVDHQSVAGLPGLIEVVVIGDFVGVVAEREEQAVKAMQALKVEWRAVPPLPDMSDLAGALLARPATPRRLLDQGQVDQALAEADQRLPRRYVWPYHIHGSIGPSCSVADYHDGRLILWSGTQNPHPLRADLARLLDLPDTAIEIRRMEAAGCYGRNCADDVGADAALLSRAVGRPVRVQLTREQEHLWEPKGAAQVMEVDGGLNADGSVAAYDFSTRYPSNAAPTLALLLTGKVKADPAILQMGDRTAIPPYDFDHMRVTVHDMAPIVRASWMRGVSALPNSFAHECYIDELASAAGVDPLEYRLRYLKDQRAIDLVKATAERAGWRPHQAPFSRGADGDIAYGQGLAYARYIHGTFPGRPAAWSAWVADVAVNRTTGEVSVTRITVGQDTGMMINPAGVQHQIHGNVIQSTSRVMKEEVTFSEVAVASREWGGYPILTFPELPAIDVVMIPRPEEEPMGAGESASVPSAAAIANAIYDATGVRFREPPFTPERIRAGLLPATALPPAEPPPPSRRRWWAGLAAAGATAIGLATAALPWRPAIAPITPPEAGVFSAATIERGRLLAEAGDCAVCHTAPGGATNAGGLGLETPFGTVYSTNLTPDPETGIGTWSYPAFERAMREGISRDGHHLYPAFPYPSFTRMTDADLQALYAYLMAQPAVSHRPPATALPFPFNLRPLLAGWNAAFLRPGALVADPARSAEWNRGAYLVESVGHCGACHSPRNALGAERGGSAHLTGGVAEGWDAPALTPLSKAPIPWSADDLFTYLRTGFSRYHGAAAGPMMPVIAGLNHLPDSDLKAIAHYLTADQGTAQPAAEREARARGLEARAAATLTPAASPAARLYQGACAVCHQSESGPELFGVKPSLALNTNIHGERPDNLIRVILDGLPVPVNVDLGPMPAFRDSLSDRQIAELVDYLRTQFAPDASPWANVLETVTRLRAASH